MAGQNANHQPGTAAKPKESWGLHDLYDFLEWVMENGTDEEVHAWQLKYRAEEWQMSVRRLCKLLEFDEAYYDTLRQAKRQSLLKYQSRHRIPA
jgi:hypothetical protein